MEHELSDMDSSPGRALVTSIASTETVEALATVADVGLDAAITSGALDGVPILGLVTSLARAGQHIKDQLFVRKIARFLASLSSTTQVERQRFVNDLRNKGKIEEFGESILLILDRIDDARKPPIIGRLLAAHVEGKIAYDQAMRLAAMVNRCYAPDLEYLARFKTGTQGQNQSIADSLFSIGLLRMCGLDGGTVSDALSGGTIYELNEYAELLMRYGLNAKDF